jgi:hypothetical protein
MIPTVLQLTGAILLSFMVAFREKNEYVIMTAVITPVKGKKHPKLESLYRETWTFRIGLGYVIAGYILQIINLDSDFLLSLSRISKVLLSVFSVTLLTGIGIFISFYFAKVKYNKAPVWTPEGNNHPIGSMYLEE